MTTARILRTLASNCRQMAKSAETGGVRDELRAIANRYEGEAARIENALGLPPEWAAQ